MTDYLKLLAQRDHPALHPEPKSVPEEQAARPTEGRTPAPTPAMIRLHQEVQVLKVRMVDCDRALQPQGSYQRWLSRQVVEASVRIDQCRQDADAWRYRLARRAEVCWDIDRRAEVEDLAAGLTRRPAQVAAKLRQSRHGCEWLIARWRVLADAIRNYDRGGPLLVLDDEGRTRAFDLLGLEPAQRHGRTLLDPPPDRDAGTDGAAHQAAVIASEIAGLERLKAEGLDDLDAMDRTVAGAGHGPGIDPTLRAMRRYEAEYHRRMQQVLKELRRLQAREERPASRSEKSQATDSALEAAFRAARGDATETEPTDAPDEGECALLASATVPAAKSADRTAAPVAPTARTAAHSSTFTLPTAPDRHERRTLQNQAGGS